MLVLTCKNCNKEVTVNPHLYDAEIRLGKDHLSFESGYEAKVRSEAICPNCGNHIYNFHSCEIYTSDIIQLALRRERQV